MVIRAVKWVLFAAVSGTAVGWFVQAAVRRIGYMRLGRGTFRPPPRQGSREAPADSRKDNRGEIGSAEGDNRAGAAVYHSDGSVGAQIFGHRKLLRDIRSGIMHLLLFYGFIVLQFGALDLIWKGLAGYSLPYARPGWFSYMQEATVAVVLVAILYGVFRRYVERLQRLQRGWRPAVVTLFIGGICVTVLLTLAFERIADPSTVHDAAYAPISSAAAELLRQIGVTPGAAASAYESAWWLHLFVLLAFLVYVPQSKHFHLLTAPANLWLRRGGRVGKLEPIDLEDESAESFGVGNIEDFRRKQLLDLYACVECGRCTNVCPASNTGKLLSPMHLIVKLRDHLTEKGAAMTKRSAYVPAWVWASGGSAAVTNGRAAGSCHVMGASLPVWSGGRSAADTSIAPTMEAQAEAWQLTAEPGGSAAEVALIGGVMTEAELWSCTTCRNCEDQCPVGNEHVDKIIDMRRYLVLMEGRLPAEGQRAMQNIERQGNPWGLPRADRAAWMEACAEQTGITVETVRSMMERGERPDWVVWAGTMGAYDIRSRRVLFAFIRLLDAAGIKFAALGAEERNSGDTPRRLGNELLYQELCRDNIETLKRYGIRRIVTACPHTYHAMRNEYPDFGLHPDTEIVHHTELLAQLLEEGRLLPVHRVVERAAYHDSCYMGRYNGIYDAPRRILRAIPGIELAELERSGRNAMCCGAGGGMMWMEERTGARVNVARVTQALAVSPTVIGSGCPYCLTMMEDGLRQLEREGVAARDVAELLAVSVLGEH
ncbi:(Fe-S)-binding protein [Paenibacillus xylaniclasticus]|uniref:(Fe-S)-binding protein n=1 Tax=Paenibacillus xylaniclasticus TaxID=588083 RepID=UPI000FD7AF29|nr:MULTISPECIES: (Fe-S)-binding protein [Paenibacillus]